MNWIAWIIDRNRSAYWRGLFFAFLVIGLLVIVTNGPMDAPFLYRPGE